MPRVVLADLLGLHPNTIERWRVLAGDSPAIYAAAHLHIAQALTHAYRLDRTSRLE